MSNTKQNLCESLSALMDSEAEELELRRLLRESAGNAEIVDTWHRYQIAASAMRRELPSRFQDISGRISAAIDQEQVPVTPATRFLQPLGKVAIAASVAAVAIFGIQNFQGPAVQPQPAENLASNLGAESSGPQFQLPAGYNFAPVSARTVSTSAGRAQGEEPRPVLLIKQSPLSQASKEEIQLYLNDAMFWHAENVARNTAQGVLPYARLPIDEKDGK